MNNNTATKQKASIDEITSALASSTLFSQLQSAFCNACILILAEDSRIVFANDPVADYFPDQTPGSLLGKPLCDLLLDSCKEARGLHIKHPLETGRTAVCLELMGGVRMCSRFSLLTLQAPLEHERLVMWTLEPINRKNLEYIRDTTPPGDLYAESCFDLGVLNCLSDRELEVLALMGYGLRTREIADKLCRSVSTINRHRENLGDKLGVTDRAILIRLANLAVLEVQDAGRMRTTINALGIAQNPPFDAIERASADDDADSDSDSDSDSVFDSDSDSFDD